MQKLVYICDWLPPDFGAVGQYSVRFARERAAEGRDVLLAGLSSTGDSTTEEAVGSGRLRVWRFKNAPLQRDNFLRRAWWTVRTDFKLVRRLRKELKATDEILFTGSPPYLLHLLAPLNWLWGKRLTYRITDFHPECLMAGMSDVPFPLRLLYKLTLFWRRRVQQFEVLGEDQRERLHEIGIPDERIVIRPDPSPVTIAPGTTPLPLPASLAKYTVLLYSGNYGVAHEYRTFVEAYRRHHRGGSCKVALWLNAIGSRADMLEEVLRKENLPYFRSLPVPLEDLPRLLVAPFAHLVTLRDSFVGFVLPSKIYGCLDSGKDVMYIGSTESDVHLHCTRRLPPAAYHRADVGDVEQVVRLLEAIGARAAAQQTLPQHMPRAPKPATPPTAPPASNATPATRPAAPTARRD